MKPEGVVRWGVLGAGAIARSFAEGVRLLPDATLQAVGSRDRQRAAEFARQHGCSKAYGDYVQLVADRDVDVIYVATPHTFHREHTILALEAGKPVLCEKPFTINAAETEAIVRTARARGLFLMEGMWTRFFPLMERVRRLIREGAIGPLRLLQADFGFRAGFDPRSRLFDPALGGGALLDVGCYCVSLASMLMGSPDRITGVATLGATGVDEQAVMALGYPDGALAILSTAVRTRTPQEALLIGERGSLRLHSPWWKPQRLTVAREGLPDEETLLQVEGTGFQYEAAETARCLRAGLLESDLLPLDESLAIMRTLDTLRRQWGVRYPGEE